MTITATEFKNNLGKYLDMASSCNICITKNGNEIAILTSSKIKQKKQEALNSLLGVISQDNLDLNDEKTSRILL